MGPSRSCWNSTSAIKVPIRKKSGNLSNDPRIYDPGVFFWHRLTWGHFIIVLMINCEVEPKLLNCMR